LETESLFNTDRVELPARESLLRELKSLVRRTRSGGKDAVDTDGGVPEDEANVVAGVATVLAASARPGGIVFGVIQHSVMPDNDSGESIVPWGVGRKLRRY
jgi:hypothetical protein